MREHDNYTLRKKRKRGRQNVGATKSVSVRCRSFLSRQYGFEVGRRRSRDVSASERRGVLGSRPTMLRLKTRLLALSLSTQTLSSFPSSLSVYVSTTTTVLLTSQTYQINHTCCNVIIYIIILIGKLVTRGGWRGQTIDVEERGEVGLWGLHKGGDARCTLVLRCLQEMFRCFVQGAELSFD